MASFDQVEPRKRPELVLACLLKSLGGSASISYDVFRDIDDGCVILLHKSPEDGSVIAQLLEGEKAQKVREDGVLPRLGDPSGEPTA